MSVEELVLALAEDPRFGADLMRQEGLAREALEAAVMEIRGGKR